MLFKYDWQVNPIQICAQYSWRRSTDRLLECGASSDWPTTPDVEANHNMCLQDGGLEFTILQFHTRLGFRTFCDTLSSGSSSNELIFDVSTKRVHPWGSWVDKYSSADEMCSDQELSFRFSEIWPRTIWTIKCKPNLQTFEIWIKRYLTAVDHTVTYLER